MRRFSSQYIFTNAGEPLKRGIVTTEDDGTIVRIEDTRGELSESSAIEYYNGIIVPGFVNCHCHLELSHLKGVIKSGNGLPDFIMKVRTVRETNPESITSALFSADREMQDEGIVLCADICNNSSTFDIKRESRIKYINLLEVFGIDPKKADKRMSEVLSLSAGSEKAGLKHSIVPHSAYSVSLPLFRLIREHNPQPEITSIHFQETEAEELFLSAHSGPLRDSYEANGIMPSLPELAESHIRVIENEIPGYGSLILVHNTYTERKTIAAIRNRQNTFFCLCPGSNLYIENKLPPLDLLSAEKCDIVLGTDSLSSNTRLSILHEMKILQEHFPETGLTDLIKWATINGARALREDGMFGSIECGKRPGLLLLENADLINLKLLPGTTVKKLI